MASQWIQAAVTFGLVLCPDLRLAAQEATTRVSVDSFGGQGNGVSWNSSISSDGRLVAIGSSASNLVSNDTNGTYDVFVHDCLNGSTERVSVDSSGAQGNGISLCFAISADGRYVAFCSRATNLVAVDTNGTWDVFVRDRALGTTERVSVDSSGMEGNGASSTSTLGISADGRVVAFGSVASNLVANDTNGTYDVFVHDLSSGLTERVSVDSSGVQANDYATRPSISADGMVVAFDSPASNLIANDTNGWPDVFVHDRSTGVTERVSVDSSGAESNLDSEQATISADGQFVAFESEAWNLVSNDTNNATDVFIHDRSSGITERVSVDSAGAQGNSASYAPLISANGSSVAFQSFSTNLVSNDINGWNDGFVRNRSSGITEIVTVDSSGIQGNDGSAPQAISADGRFVVFGSFASNLVVGDTNGVGDVFIRGPYLTIEVDPRSPPAGATLTFSTWTGDPNNLSLLVVTDINGLAVFLPAVLGSFDATGLWTLSGIVPTGLSGNAITFETIGFLPTGRVSISNPFAVSFQ